MKLFQSFIKSLQSQGAHVIIITDKSEQFSDIKEIHIVDEWLKSWEIVDRLVGEKLGIGKVPIGLLVVAT